MADTTVLIRGSSRQEAEKLKSETLKSEDGRQKAEDRGRKLKR